MRVSLAKKKCFLRIHVHGSCVQPLVAGCLLTQSIHCFVMGFCVRLLDIASLDLRGWPRDQRCKSKSLILPIENSALGRRS